MGMLQPWKTLNREPLFSGGPIKEIARETVLLPDGRVIPDYYTAAMGDYAERPPMFHAPDARLTCSTPNGVWHFTVRGDSLVGELRLPDGNKFRDVRAVRSR